MYAYDYVVVGAGLSGGVLARMLAEENDKKILIVERRNHVAGNTYDYLNDYGIKIQKYGPHVFHTNYKKVYDFITKFCEPINYSTKCEAIIDGVSTPSPFNFKTIDQFYDEKDAKKLKEKLVNYYKGKSSVTVIELLESDDVDIKKYAEFLFEKDYRPYTAKQWNLKPEDIDPSVLKRVPIVLSYGETYFYDKYEFIPENGFSELYKKMIDHRNITIMLETDALEHITFNDNKVLYDGIDLPLIYTGAIDELFNYCYGILPYRSLYFRHKNIMKTSFQNAAIVAYPQVNGYTRITEYTKMPFQENNVWTSIAYEYPVPYDKTSKVGNEPYYPVLTEDSIILYEKYAQYSKKYKNLILCGRLADFKYYNMDQVVLRALDLYNSLEVE